jgi:hypothetical protein
VFSPASPTSVCIVWDRDDAPLIAAAPDLLAALLVAEDLVHGEYCGRVCKPACLQITAAIAKAEGR